MTCDKTKSKLALINTLMDSVVMLFTNYYHYACVAILNVTVQ